MEGKARPSTVAGIAGLSQPSNFHALVSALTCEYEQTVSFLRKEVEHFRAVALEASTEQQSINRDATDKHQVTMQQISSVILPRVKSRNTNVDVDTADLDQVRPEFASNCETDAEDQSRATTETADLDNISRPSARSAERRAKISETQPEERQIVASGMSSINVGSEYPHQYGSKLWIERQSTVSIPKAKMNWAKEVADEIPNQTQWAKELGDFLSKWCPACCGRRTLQRLETCVSWLEQVKEPSRSGVVYRLVESHAFHFAILFVIFMNTVFVIITTNIDMDDALSSGVAHDRSDSTSWRLIGESSFTLVYCLELLLKLQAHGYFLFIGQDYRWNLFDFLLVFFSVADLALQLVLSSSYQRPNLTFLRALRILKFARVLRMVRIVKCVHELKLMLDCMIHSVIHLFWSVVLIALVLIMFSLLIVQGMRDYVVDEGAAARDVVVGRFDTVQQTMLSLYMATTGGEDWGEQYQLVGNGGSFFEVVYIVYISFFMIVAWNIVMSSFVEKAFRLAMPDFESTVLEKRQESLAYAKELRDLLVCKLDRDHDDYISLEEFESQLSDKTVKDFFAARDLNMGDAELFFKMLLAVEQSHEVHVNTFVGACLRLRGLATAIDLQTLHFEMRNLYQKQEHRIKGIAERLETTFRAISSNCAMVNVSSALPTTRTTPETSKQDMFSDLDCGLIQETTL